MRRTRSDSARASGDARNAAAKSATVHRVAPIHAERKWNVEHGSTHRKNDPDRRHRQAVTEIICATIRPSISPGPNRSASAAVAYLWQGPRQRWVRAAGSRCALACPDRISGSVSRPMPHGLVSCSVSKARSGDEAAACEIARNHVAIVYPCGVRDMKCGESLSNSPTSDVDTVVRKVVQLDALPDVEQEGAARAQGRVAASENARVLSGRTYTPNWHTTRSNWASPTEAAARRPAPLDRSAVRERRGLSNIDRLRSVCDDCRRCRQCDASARVTTAVACGKLEHRSGPHGDYALREVACIGFEQHRHHVRLVRSGMDRLKSLSE